jgi:HSP20 family protein
MMLREFAAPGRSSTGFRDMRLPEVFRDARMPDVLRDMRRAQEEMNRLFGGLRFALRSEFPAVNLWTSPDGVIVTAQVPGVSPDQLDVTVHQDTVTLRGKREAETFDGEVAWHRQERPLGPFSRTLVLPFRVDADRVSARFERGLLTLELPRPESDKPRQVKITHA